MNPKIPFQHSYWVVPGKLLAGVCPGTVDPAMVPEHVSALVDAGITLVINLMELSETELIGRFIDPYESILANLGKAQGRTIHTKRLPIEDRSIPTKKQMASILKTIRGEMDAGGLVYVHCMGGIGRTGTVIGCYLAEQGHPNPLGQLAALSASERKYFWPTPQTKEQLDFVLNWKPGDGGKPERSGP